MTYLLFLLRRRSSRVLPVLALALIATTTRLLEPCIFGRVVDLLAAVGSSNARLGNIPVASLCLAWVCATWACTLLSSVASFLALRLGRDVSEAAYIAGYDAALALPFEEHLRQDSSSPAKVLTDAKTAAWDMTHLLIWRGATVVMGTAGTFLIACWTSPAMTLVYAILMPTLAVFMAWQGRKLQHLQDTSSDDADALYQQLVDHLANITVFETNPCRSMFRSLHCVLARTSQSSQHRVNRHWLLVDLAAPEAIGRTVVLVSGVWLVATGQMTLGVFAMFMVLIGELLTPLSLLADVCPIYVRHANALARLDNLLARSAAVDSRRNETARRSGDAPITTLAMHNVSYSYTDGNANAGVRNLSMTFRHNTVYAIVGRSGSGKTTVARLLTGLLTPQSGIVQIDDTDIRCLDKNWLANHIAMVSQDGGVFNDTVWTNILCGRPEADPDDIRDAARRAGVTEFATTRDCGLFTNMGQCGGVFSGGETQRVMIARALLKKAHVVIMDEPTSALDPVSESQFRRVVDSLREGRIVILVAHRSSIVHTADHIYVMCEGTVVEQGSHRELVDRAGVYADLFASSQP